MKMIHAECILSVPVSTLSKADGAEHAAEVYLEEAGSCVLRVVLHRVPANSYATFHLMT